MKSRAVIIFIWAVIKGLCLVADLQAQATPTATAAQAKLDIVLVLDNSGSMKAHDPQFLTKQVVASFLDGLAPGTRLGLVIFAEKAVLTLPLTALGQTDTRQKVLDGLAQVDYSGHLTNSPAGIERAYYECESRVGGRP